MSAIAWGARAGVALNQGPRLPEVNTKFCLHVRISCVHLRGEPGFLSWPLNEFIRLLQIFILSNISGLGEVDRTNPKTPLPALANCPAIAFFYVYTPLAFLVLCVCALKALPLSRADPRNWSQFGINNFSVQNPRVFQRVFLSHVRKKTDDHVGFAIGLNQIRS